MIFGKEYRIVTVIDREDILRGLPTPMRLSNSLILPIEHDSRQVLIVVGITAVWWRGSTLFFIGSVVGYDEHGLANSWCIGKNDATGTHVVFQTETPVLPEYPTSA